VPPPGEGGPLRIACEAASEQARTGRLTRDPRVEDAVRVDVGESHAIDFATPRKTTVPWGYTQP
jgi:hypothetical protein